MACRMGDRVVRLVESRRLSTRLLHLHLLAVVFVVSYGGDGGGDYDV